MCLRIGAYGYEFCLGIAAYNLATFKIISRQFLLMSTYNYAERDCTYVCLKFGACRYLGKGIYGYGFSILVLVFAPYQHLRAYQDRYRLVTVCTHVDLHTELDMNVDTLFVSCCFAS